MRFLLSLFSIILLGVSMPATAADIGSELDQCRAIESLARRLQCYDNLVDGLAASGMSTVVPDRVQQSPSQNQPTLINPPVPRSQRIANDQNVTNQTAQSSAKPKVEAEALFGKKAIEVKEVVNRELEITSVDQISSEVTRVQVSPSKEYVVYLANGQVWRQKDKAGKWRIKVGETAIISKAALGSFLMKSNARKKSVRAERIR